jgi:hypothetical protein
MHVSNINVNKLILYPVNHRDVIAKDHGVKQSVELPKLSGLLIDPT